MNITIREPGSAFTHFIAMLLTIFAAVPLLIRTGLSSTGQNFYAMIIFVCSMILLYGSSATYHTVTVKADTLRIFRKLDHMMIFVLIAGSYTPVCMIVLNGKIGTLMLILVWGIAAAGMLLNLFWITCPKWLSSMVYIMMGWVVIFAFKPLYSLLSMEAFLWLLGGGIIYTIGGVIYALKLKLFNAKHSHFGSHEIFHLFVMAGSACHIIFMYLYVAPLA